MFGILDINSYNEGMAKSMADKAFFLRQLPLNKIHTMIDYGCGDGTLLSMMPKEWNLWGVDADAEMVKLAIAQHPDIAFSVHNSVPHLSKTCGETALLNLSSVIHEVYSYCTPLGIKEFWLSIENSNIKYVTIRDLTTNIPIQAQSSTDDLVALMKQKDELFTQEQLVDYANAWRSVTYKRDLIHFLLKYRYTDNWYKEVRENYFSLSVNQLLRTIPPNYRVIYQRTYCLPFVHDKIMQDFGIDIQDTTHIQLILERRDD